MPSNAIAKKPPIARTGLVTRYTVTIRAPATSSPRACNAGYVVNTRDVCFVGLPAKPVGDTRAGDRLCRVLDGLHRACELGRAAVCLTTLPRRGHPESAAADSHAQPAAWRERYRRFQYGDCSTKRDCGSPIRVISRFIG